MGKLHAPQSIKRSANMHSRDEKSKVGKKGLPKGWTVDRKTYKSGPKSGMTYPCFIAPETGCKFYNMRDVYRYTKGELIKKYISKKDISKTAELIEKCTPKPKRSGLPQPKDNKREAAAGLPEGWILETVERKTNSQIRRKDPYYIDPETGYAFRSKPDALRYIETGDINKCAMKPQKRDINTMKASNEKSSCDIAPENGGGFYSKTKVSGCLKGEPSKRKHISKAAEQTGEKSSDVTQPKDNVYVERREAGGGLPAGWIHETIVRKIGSRIRKDPYYIDPETGYAFRSRPDALRYLENGDIKNCAIKPKKRDMTTMIAINKKTSPPAKGKRQKLKAGQSSQPDETARDGQSSVVDHPLPDLNLFQDERKKVNSLNSEEETIDGHDLEFSLARVIPLSEYYANQAKYDSAGPSSIAPPEAKSDLVPPEAKSDLAPPEAIISKKERRGRPSKRGRGRRPNNVATKKLVSGPPEMVVPSDNQLVDNPVEKHERSTTQRVRKRKEKKELDTPRRASKRLAAIGAAVQEATPSVAVSEHPLTKCMVEQPTNQAGPEQSRMEEKSDKEPESSVIMPSVDANITVQDYLQDPCLEFAFKTLTGEIPVAEDLVGQDYLQPQMDSIQAEPINGSAMGDINDITVEDFVREFDPFEGPALEIRSQKPESMTGNGSLVNGGGNLE